MPEPFHNSGDPLSPEDAKEIVVQGQIKPGRPGIPLSARTPPELIVDPAALMAFGPQDMQPAQFLDPLPQNNVGSPAGHIGGNGDGPHLTCHGDDFRFLLVDFRIEDLMLESPGASISH